MLFDGCCIRSIFECKDNKNATNVLCKTLHFDMKHISHW